MDINLQAKLAGVNAIHITPFDHRNQIDYHALEQNLSRLLENNITAIYPCGNTGEFYSLSLAETKQLTAFSTKHVDGRAKVIAGIGYSVPVATELAKHAEMSGADGVMIHQPPHPFQSERGMLEYYRQIARNTELPVVLYIRSPSVSLSVLAELATELNIVAVKYAINDLLAFSEAVQTFSERFVWICGTAELFAPYFFAAGAVGFTSGLVNVDASRSLLLLNYLQNNDYKNAMGIWNQIRPFEELRAVHNSANNVSVVKEAMAQLGISDARVRPPISPLDKEDKEQVRTILTQWGLLGN